MTTTEKIKRAIVLLEEIRALNISPRVDRQAVRMLAQAKLGLQIQEGTVHTATSKAGGFTNE